MADLIPNAPDAVLVCDVPASGTGFQPGILDILIPQANSLTYPPVLHVVISATATVKVRGALSVTKTSVPSLVDGTDISSGGFTVENFYDLVPGVRFYQVEITANTGTVRVWAGFGQLLMMMNNAPQGT